MYNRHKHRTFVGKSEVAIVGGEINRYELGFDLDELLYSDYLDLLHTSVLLLNGEDGDTIDEFDCGAISYGAGDSVLLDLMGTNYDLTIAKSNGIYQCELHEKQGGGGGGDVTVDASLSLTSKNPVQNKVITLELNGKTVKHLLHYNGTNITENGLGLTYAQIYEMLMNKPDFVVLVYNDRAYHPNIVKASEIVFVSTISSNGYITLSRISIQSNNSVSISDGSAEMLSNKVSTIADSQMYDTNKYPSNNAVMRRVHPLEVATQGISSIPEATLVGAINALPTAHAVKEYVDTLIGGLEAYADAIIEVI